MHFYLLSETVEFHAVLAYIVRLLYSFGTVFMFACTSDMCIKLLRDLT